MFVISLTCNRVVKDDVISSTLECWLAECRGEVELLTAVVDLVDGPQDAHLVAGSVEPVVAAVQSSRS